MAFSCEDEAQGASVAIGKFKIVSGLVCLAAATTAQQVQAQSSNDWSGCYVGGHAGYGRASIKGWSDLNPPNQPSIGSTTATGGALGGQAGCDLQAANWVLGAQLSLSLADIAGSHRYKPFGSGPADRVTYDVGSMATLTGRLGYLFRPDTLAYLKAGAARTRTNHDDSDPAPLFGPPYTGDTTATRNGWLLGIGLEHRFDRNLTAYVEYVHMGFGKKTVTISYTDGVIASYPFRQRMDFFGVGLNYRF